MWAYGRAASPKTLGLVGAAVAGVVALGMAAVARDLSQATPTPQVFIEHASYTNDFRDKRVLVGVSEYVFLGEVIAQVGTEGIPTSDPEYEIPQTQFSVKVLEEIKGALPDEVVVSQGSGIDKTSGALILLDGDPLLQPGEIVLFAVNPSLNFDWYTIVAGPYGAIRAKDVKEAAALVAEFRLAAQDAFVPVPDPDIQSEKDLERRQAQDEPRR